MSLSPPCPAGLLRAASALALVLALLAPTPARPQAPGVPGFAELEAAGARIGEIRIVTRDIFDTSDPRENNALFRWANKLHIQTRPGVIERALLFRRGDALSVRVLEESERVLRSERYLYDVHIRPVAWHDGVVDIEVETRDTWTLDPGLSAGRTGGTTSSGIGLREYNLLGTGVTVALGHSRTVDRSGNEFMFQNERAFGSWTSVSYLHASNSDGQRNALSVVRPYYSLDARWAAGITSSRDDRIDAFYSGGNLVSEYRHREDRAEVFGGWSAGLVQGWTRRLSLGLSLRDDAYATEPGRVAPARLPVDDKLRAPFVRLEWIEDRFDRQLNRNLIGRPEFFALGTAARVQLGWSSTGLDASRDALLYAGALSRGFEPWPEHTLITGATLEGRYSDGQVRRQRLNAQARYYLPQGRRWLFYGAATLDALTRPEAVDLLPLGGDNGLRGYPLRYQYGSRRALFTLEERFYTDLYVWRLFRVGGAAFVDIGRAWGGPDANLHSPGWLADAGVGLRIVSARSAFSNVLHIDLAFPLDADASVKKLQLLVKTKTSF
ncbi:MAG: hypothetical protein HY855_08995 [Burkholderiales bacterium]|nr:hypothetical protein [Burkholderiales bacterium]